MFGHDFKIFFQKVIDELNELSYNGLVLGGSNHVIYFQLLMVVGDNLGLNSVCGFVESFKATRFCRIFRANKNQCAYMTREDPKLLKNIDNYECDVKDADPKTGVKGDCIFNFVNNFHITKNRSLDLMHDGSE